jgi:Transcriptional regulator
MNYNEQRKRQSERTEALILKTALRLMHEHGFDGVSIREICREAGITTGAFYHHFTSKDVLLLACFGPLKGHLSEAWIKYANFPSLERIRQMVIAYAEFMSQEGELLAKYYQYRLGQPAVSSSFDDEDYLRHALAQALLVMQEQGILPSDISVKETASFLHCHYRGIVIDWILQNYAYSLKDSMLKDFELFLSLFSV